MEVLVIYFPLSLGLVLTVAGGADLLSFSTTGPTFAVLSRSRVAISELSSFGSCYAWAFVGEVAPVGFLVLFDSFLLELIDSFFSIDKINLFWKLQLY